MGPYIQGEGCKCCMTKRISTFILDFEMVFLKAHPSCITVVPDADLPYGAEGMGEKNSQRIEELF